MDEKELFDMFFKRKTDTTPTNEESLNFLIDMFFNNDLRQPAYEYEKLDDILKIVIDNEINKEIKI